MPALLSTARRSLKSVRDTAEAVAYRGTGYDCPVCGYSGRRFVALKDRTNAICPSCRSVERNRAMWLMLQDRTPLFRDPLKVLHFAPEPALAKRLRGQPNLDYTTADLFADGVDLQIDITASGLADASFDVILCSHVLEHIDDDHAAMTELRRLLRPGGWAFLVVPHDPTLTATYEDPSITDPRAREAAFGQFDHVRWYAGPDFDARLRRAGFAVEDVTVGDPALRARHALDGPGVVDWFVIVS